MFSPDGERPTVHALFEERALAEPDALAVTCDGRSLTYRQLDERANGLAALLRETHGVGTGSLVAVLQDRSEHVLVSILAVLKAGGAYVPVDPGNPDERIAFVLRDTGARTVLTDEVHTGRLAGVVEETGLDGVVTLPVDTTLIGGESSRPQDAPPVAGDHLAYVIYTSGTTGRPKGVMVEHRSVVNYIRNVSARLGLSASDTCGFSTSLSFDLTVTTTLACLALGGQVAVYDGSVRDVDAYLRFLTASSVTFVKLTPAYFGLFADRLDTTGVTKVVLGGEKLGSGILGRIRTRDDQALTVYDEYGPTETTVGATLATVYPIAPDAEPNIGRMYDGYQGHVLDSEGRPVPSGETGELYIGGEGLARGYLDRPELTAERFVGVHLPASDTEAPAGTDGPTGRAVRLYRTGDLVRELPDGSLVYVGRNDHQVKIRGHRVELGEIETLLEQHGDVVQAVVVAVADDPDQPSVTLAAHVVPGEFGCSREELDEHLARVLPEYMLPGDFFFHESLPLTANGKVDRAALGGPAAPRSGPSGEYVAPRTPLEHTVREIWSELLHVGDRSIGVTDDFFKLGGDSIVAIQLLSRLRRRLGVHIPVNEFFSRNTIGRLCEFLTTLQGHHTSGETGISSEHGDLTGDVPLLPIQDWFFDSDFPRPGHWNQAFLVRTPQLDVERLRAAVRALGRHHGAFRLRYGRTDDGKPVQYYAEDFEPGELVVGTLDDGGSLADVMTSWQNDFSLETGPVHRVGYVDGFADGSARILVACHHLTVDAVSWRILAEDLRDLYDGRDLPAPGSSYRQWSEAVRAYPAAHPAERAYWRDALTAFERTGDAALRRLVRSEETRTVSGFELGKETTRRLLLDSNRAHHTQINDVLLTAFTHALAQVTGEREHHILLEGHGREDIDPRLDVARTVGWFTTLFPVRTVAEDDFRASLVDIKETLRRIPAKGIGYGAFFGYDARRLPRVNFNYLGQFGTEEAPADDGQWRITREPAGQAVHPLNPDHNIITVNGLVLDGELTFTLVSKLAPETGDQLAESFRRTLVELVDELARAPRALLTASDVGHVVSGAYLDKIQAEREIDGVYLANSLQQGFIYHAVTQGQVDDAYIVQTAWSYGTAIDPEVLHEAWRCAQRRFAGLRLRFGWQDELVQIIDAQGNVDWRYADLSDRAPGKQEEELRQLRAADRAEPYDLSRGSLFRVHLVKLQPDRYSCLFSSHHAILDGWSNTVLLNFVHDAYQRLVDGLPIDAAPERSYAAGQRYLQEHRNDHTEFWRDYLAGYDERMDLEGMRGARARARDVRIGETRLTQEMREVSFTVPAALRDELRGLLQESGLTVNALFLYVWHKVLGLYTGSGWTVSGLVVSGRGIPVNDIESAVGLLINTLPLVVGPGGPDETVREGVRAVQRQINECNARSNVDLSSLHQGDGRLFDTLFIYENWPRLDRDGWQGRLRVRFEGEYEKLDYPLSAIVSETPDGIDFRLAYAAELFDAGMIEEVLNTQRHLIGEVARQFTRPWRELRLVDDERRQRVEALLGSGRDDGPVDAAGDAGHVDDSVFHERFAAQARLTPNRTAVVARGVGLTYRELDERANRLADMLLRTYGVRQEEPVVLCLDKGLDLMVSMLAVMKAGGAYVPVDPGHPSVRIAHVLKDTSARVVLTTSDRQGVLGTAGAEEATVLVLDCPGTTEALARASAAGPGTRTAGSHLMYILHTSGSTGSPKGVMVEHRSFRVLLDAVREAHFANRTALSTFSVTSHVFDIFGLEYGLPLLTGGRVELAGELPSEVDCRGLDFVQMTPSVCELLLDRLEGAENTVLFLGGEKLEPQLLGRALAASLGVVHVYGPTETTIWSTSRLYRDSGAGTPPVDLGQPLAQESAHILDASLRPLPAGAVGELCIGGAGLARGYLNRDALTAERFVTALLPGTDGVRLYRTGDLTRLHPGGGLEHLGRNDFQVKIRGHRVEPGEIEAALGAHPEVRQCVVHVQDTGVPTLVGYYTARHDLGQADLARLLHRSLPGHMVPSVFVRLDTLPLTASGKLDRAALPLPNFTGARTPAPPRDGLDEQVRAVMAEVLGRPPEDIGIDDDFFRIGGNSILSIRLVSALERTAGIAVEVHHLLTHRTVREFVDHLGDASLGFSRIVAAADDVEDASQGHPLSFAQERLWFIEKFEGGTDAYHLPLVLRVADDADSDALARSVRDLVRRHEVLRTVIKEGVDGTGRQLVLGMDVVPSGIETVPVTDLTAMHERIRRDIHQVFDLEHELPLRVRLFEVAEPKGRYLSFVIHHVAFDGWSTDVVLQDLRALHALHTREVPGTDAPAALPLPGARYRDFALWQRARLSGERMSGLLEFWERKLSGFETLALPTDHARPERVDYRGARRCFDVGTFVSRRLRSLAAELGVSLFSLLLSGYCLTLRAFSGQDDIVVGTPVANRDNPQLEHVVGFFVNTLPVRSRIEAGQPVTDYVRATAREVLDVLRHQELPFEQLVEALGVRRDTSRHPVFQVAFGVQSFGAPSHEERDRAEQVLSVAEETTGLYTAAKFDLSTFVDDGRENLRIDVTYATSLYDSATVASLGEAYLHILRQLAELSELCPDAVPGEESGRPTGTVPATGPSEPTVDELALLDPTSLHRVVHEWNTPNGNHVSDALLHELFTAQAERTPDAVAVVWQERRVTYRQLDERANRLAHHLMSDRALGPDSLVMLCLDRSDSMIVAMLAVLKAGAAYVPVDPAHPDERVAFVLEDTGARHVLTQECHAERLATLAKTPADDAGVRITAVDAPALLEELAAAPATAPATRTAATDLAYVIYTSGTTGVPKGALTTHSNVVRLFSSSQDLYGFGDNDVWTLFHSYVFDFSVWEMWGALLHGGRLVVPSYEQTRDLELFHALCREERVTVLNQTPTAFYQFSEVCLAKGDDEGLKDLRYVIFGGEALNVSLLSPWFARYGDDSPRLVNMYGITETTVHVTHRPLGAADTGDSASLGRPLPDLRAYVLDRAMRPLPVGAVGELFVGGAGLARGYLNRPELTEERFVADPFRPGERLYRSGDLARWAPDGTLEYFGRNDFQVKIGGHRVELSEVEALLARIAGVRQCAVVPRRHADGDLTYLVGYYVADDPLDPGAVLTQLRATLPEYMIPSAAVPLDRLPLTINGKLDHQALPEPRLAAAEGFVGPRNALEANVREVMAQVIGLEAEKIGVLDDFFGLGGNSLLSIKFTGRLSRELGLEVSIASLFRHRSVAELVRVVESGRERPVVIERSVPKDGGGHVLSFAQERLWFIDRYEQGTDAYNVQLCYEVAPTADLGVLERSLRAVHERHDVLRTVIGEDADGEPYQRVLAPARCPLPVGRETVPDTAALQALLRQEAAYRFDLTRESPFRVAFHTLEQADRPAAREPHAGPEERNDRGGRTFVTLLIHHIAFDGWSTEVLLRELHEFYDYFAAQAAGADATLDLPELTVQYRDFAAWQRRHISGERLAGLLEHWRTRLAGHPPLALPTDFPRPASVDYRGSTVPFALDADTSRALRRLAAQLNVSLFSVLLTAYGLLLRAFAGQSDVIVGVPVFNRQYEQTQHLLGCFVNSLAVGFRIDDTVRVPTLIQQVAARVAEAQQHQDLPFDQLVSALRLPRDASRHPLFQVWFDVNSFTTEDSRAQLLRAHPVDDGSERVTRFDLGVEVDASHEVLTGALTYAVALFGEDAARRFAETYTSLLGQLATVEDVSSLSWLPSGSREEVVALGLGERDGRPGSPSLGELFRTEVQAALPDAPALLLGDTPLTYRQLDEYSDRLATGLGARTDGPVALRPERTVRTMIAVLAVWKAGGRCVPAGPEDTVTPLPDVPAAAAADLSQAVHDPHTAVGQMVLALVDGRIPELAGPHRDLHVGLLDGTRRLLPRGAVGELVVTDRATGVFARWRPDGLLAHIGRDQPAVTTTRTRARKTPARRTPGRARRRRAGARRDEE